MVMTGKFWSFWMRVAFDKSTWAMGLTGSTSLFLIAMYTRRFYWTNGHDMIRGRSVHQLQADEFTADWNHRPYKPETHHIFMYGPKNPFMRDHLTLGEHNPLSTLDPKTGQWIQWK